MRIAHGVRSLGHRFLVFIPLPSPLWRKMQSELSTMLAIFTTSLLPITILKLTDRQGNST